MPYSPLLLAVALGLALSACADRPADAPGDATPPASASTPAPAPVPAPPAGDGTIDDTAPAPAGSACAIDIEGDDRMQFNVDAITIPSTCTDFTITLRHTGRMPVAAMGHNVVVTREADMPRVAADGLGAGLDAGYLEPGDERVLAHTELVGGGGITSVTFPVAKLRGDGPHAFFCSFPGHAGIMKGSIAVE